ncbi:alpha-1,4-glucan:maltose-1-phosphate maltosyltransferase [Streptomyces sp. Amel2xB2]|uniref:maltotransferase domain-containing protein n=1 Tax=Streptomyces sp. Amel2xB2 TaxID=1305829 RepID=UPI000DBF5DFF|nr:maltotransferase domain-containing protein [Streptomyces sp. Amel2xB2]RAJ63331.1 alpha-1,4-glucan:maltose-1-phosphate maltosyltransferase [Streptomyces sp. Amel2xB2]
MIGRIPVLDVRPLVDCGRHPAKAVPGETFQVSATIVREGHDALGADIVLRDATGRRGPWTVMREIAPGTDRWAADITPDSEGRWTYAIEAWSDPVTTWRRRAKVKVPAGIDTEALLEEGAVLHERAAAGVPRSEGRDGVLAVADALRSHSRGVAARLAAALTPQVTAVLERYPLRELVTTTRPLPLQVERERAGFGSWYEFFPRSEGAVLPEREDEPPVSGTFRTAAERLEGVAAMGFDVVCLPPVHPVGDTFRRGPGGAPSAGPDDVGSPWAVGSAAGGHEAVHPDLGTAADFAHFVERARSLGMEVALDFALQCSPDHPWIKEHPEWFAQRPDGVIAPAEGPSGVRQDIVPLAFDTDGTAYTALVRETLRLLRLWMARGVRIFRIDEPDAKPVGFWEKIIGDVNRSDPDVVFLAGAFTRAAMTHTLAKAGFQQSCTQFIRYAGKRELTEHLTELSGPAASWLRPHFALNTPGILPASLQGGGPAVFATRAVLAATLSPSWGMYAGYELCEGQAARPGSEEHSDAETYRLRPRDWDAAEESGHTLAPLIGQLNMLRRTRPALRELRSLTFHECDNEQVVAYSKYRTVHGGPDGAEGMDGEAGPRTDAVLVVVSLDADRAQEATVTLEAEDLRRLGLSEAQAEGAEPFPVRDELTGRTYEWGRTNRVRLAAEAGYPAAALVLTPGHGPAAPEESGPEDGREDREDRDVRDADAAEAADATGAAEGEVADVAEAGDAEPEDVRP